MCITGSVFKSTSLCEPLAHLLTLQLTVLSTREVLLILFQCVKVFCLPVYLYTTCVPGTLRRYRILSGLELKVVVGHHVCVWD